MRRLELTGKKFRHLEVLGLSRVSDLGTTHWNCLCDCGKTVEVQGCYLKLKNGKASCGCRPRRVAMDLTGHVYGRLTVVRRTDRKIGNMWVWECLCSCGTTKESPIGDLRSGHTKSCGCLSRELLKLGHRILPEGECGMRAIYGRYRQSAQKKGRDFALTLEAFKSFALADCHYCGAAPRPVAQDTAYRTSYNGVDRVDSSMGYSIDNCVTCCSTCNIAKSDMSVVEFYDWMSRAHDHSIVKNRRTEVWAQP